MSFVYPLDFLLGATDPASGRSLAQSNYGTDLVFNGKLIADASGDYALVTGIQNLKNSILRRLYTRRGEYKLKPLYGVGLPSYLKQKLTATVLNQLQHDIRANVLQDRRVALITDITLTPFTAQNGSQCLSVVIVLKAFGGTITFSPPSFTESH